MMRARFTERVWLCVLGLALVAGIASSVWRGASAETGRVRAEAELPVIALTNPVGGFSQPVSITHAGDGSGRVFVVEQGGRIKIIKNGVVNATPFLDISTRISTGGERGLLGLAFPPNYASKNHFYVNYTNTAGNTVIARFRVTANADVADPASEQIVLPIAQPFANHNGGQLAFSPRDGYLYIGMGDGGSGGDPQNNGQNPLALLGKMLRIDVETGNPATYTVPASNPFVGRTDFRPEIWALGMRNPWRFSFDRLTHDLYIADVGQGTWEEIDFQPAASNGAENYGWRIMEGTHCFNPPGCSTFGLTMPIWEYNHSAGDCSVTGGVVYRGAQYARMQGLYFYADFCSGRIWTLRRENGTWQNVLMLDTDFQIATFGEDETGNAYVAGYNTGVIWKITDTLPAPTPTPTPASQPTVQFNATNYNVAEDCTEATITVTLSAPSTSVIRVDYATADNTTKQKSDYTFASGQLVFPAGTTSQSFKVLITEDAYAEPTEILTLSLSNLSGPATYGAQINAVLNIADDGDTAAAAPNSIDDAATFVGQHYHDFLNRQADASGQAFWTGQITACGANAACIDDRRHSVSAAFFLSTEFQATGYFVYRFEKASFNRLPRYEPFLRDARRVGDGVIVGELGWEAKLQANRVAFSQEWINRAEFRGVYDGMTREQYVDALFANSETVPTTAERDAAIAAYGAGGTDGRAAALRSIADSASVYNKQYNPAFVLMQYFGYLRRNPNDAPNTDFSGYNFWLGKLNSFSQAGEDVRDETVARARVRRAEMVRAFIISTEYRERFGRP